MKKMRNLLALAIIGSVIFVSCNGDDTTKPVVTLKGAADTTIVLNGTWTDPGAIAEDDEDGVITDIQVTGTVNVNLTGTYVITYSATDAAGNTGTKSRTVRVRNTADVWAGGYKVIDVVGSDTYEYDDVLTASSIENKFVWVTRFANYKDGAVEFEFINPDSASTTVILPEQDVTCGTSPYVATRKFIGNGTATSFSKIVINYTETVGDESGVTGKETYTKK